MRLFMAIGLWVLSLFLLTGCWDKSELTEFGYVQAVAIDQDKAGKNKLTTLFYIPTGGEQGGSGKKEKQGILIKTSANTVFEAIRDIPIHLGRIPKWDHMRIILIGEELAKKQSIAEVLDFFSRDQQPRAIVRILIAKGKAGDYLEIKPFIEQTIGQQLRKIEDSTAKFSAKSSKIPLLDLAINLKSETGVAMIPYVFRDEKPNEVSVAGLVLLKKGKMSSTVTPADTRRLLMLTDKYQSGILQFPCTGASEEKKNAMESFEVNALDTKITPIIKNNEVSIRVLTKIKGSVGELRCTSLKTKEDGERFAKYIEKQMEQELRKAITLLQKEKMDAIGVGDQIYRKKPALWKRWKPTWNERFAESRFVVDVEMTLLNSGLNVGTPFSK